MNNKKRAHKNNRQPSRTEVNNLKQEIKLLRDNLDSLKQSLDPIIKEKQAENEAKDKIIISCDASCVNDNRSAIGVIIRGDVIKAPAKEYISITKPSPSKTCNEAELDAIYEAVNTLSNTLLHTLRDPRVLSVEIRSDSQLCVGWLTGKKKSKVPKLTNKINIIRDTIKTLSMLNKKQIKLVWRARNSTYDLKLANDECQRTNQVKIH